MMNSNDTIKLSDSWKKVLQDEFHKPYMLELKQFLKEQKQQGKTIFPRASLWFNALDTTPLEQVKVVILGQDPYPTPGHAHGLCFSAMPEVKPLPKSLVNIFKELKADLGIENQTAYLQPWAEQGVLLLNSVLTVESGNPGSHQNKGWEKFTDQIIQILNAQERPIAFILWGAYAQKKGKHIDRDRHLVIESPHPSPLSAHRGFFGSKPFSRVNAFLREHGQTEINWQL